MLILSNNSFCHVQKIIRKTTKSISAVKKIKLDMAPKSAFKHSRHSSAGELRVATVLKLPKKPEKLTAEMLISQGRDLDYLTNWSINVNAIEDWTEKSRIVWIILNDMNLIEEYNIDLKVFCDFVSQVREGYCSHNNPYHNYDHGVSGK